MIKIEELMQKHQDFLMSKYGKSNFTSLRLKRVVTSTRGFLIDGVPFFDILRQVFKSVILPTSPLMELLYCLYYKIENRPNCIVCGGEITFENFSTGYHRFCSTKCSVSNPKVKEKYQKTMIEKYGTDNPLESPILSEKRRNTCLERYGVEHYSQTEEYLQKIHSTNLKNFGVECAAKSPIIKEKTKQTCLSRFGSISNLATKKHKELSKQKCLKKYGVENFSQAEECKKKYRETCIKRYGVKNVSNLPEIKDKIREKQRLQFFKKLLNSDRLKALVSPLFEFNDYNGVKEKYQWKCNKCGNIFEDHLDCGKIPRCKICFPNFRGSSKLETEVTNFCRQYYPTLIVGNRNVLEGKELDIWIRSIKMGIEFDGLYWHSDLSGTSSEYHLQKTTKCNSKGIQLIHIFEDEWIEKQDIVKSILLSKMNKLDTKIAARKCQIKDVPNKEAKSFLFDNHLQGPINGQHFGLYYQNNLVSLLTMGKPRFNKKYDWEILRFCCKNFTIVQGGLSRLLAHFRKNHSGQIITYVDRRYGDGHGYEKVGFQKVRETEPGYYYLTSNYTRRESRMKYQKHKLSKLLENFDPNLTEWENMQLNGFDRIWDCGNLVYAEERTSYK